MDFDAVALVIIILLAAASSVVGAGKYRVMSELILKIPERSRKEGMG